MKVENNKEAKVTPSPSLQDLEAGSSFVPPVDKTDEVEEGKEKEEEGEDKVGGEEEGKKSLEKKTKEDEASGEEEEEEEEGDGSGKEAKVTTEDEPEFWEEVAKLTGEKIEGEFDTSPEGAIKFAKAYSEREIEKFEATLEQRLPDAYAYMLHLDQGGTRESFFNNQQEVDYSTVVLDKNNKEQLKSVIISNLKAKGLDDKKANKYVNALEDGGELLGEAEDALKERVLSQATTKAEKQQQAALKAEQDNKAVGKFIDIINTTINAGTVGNIHVPDKEKKAFSKFVQDTVNYSDGKFRVIREITDEQLQDELQALYFAYKKGDLSQLVERKAITENVKKLKLSVSKNNSKLKSTEDGKKNLSLKDM